MSKILVGVYGSLVNPDKEVTSKLILLGKELAKHKDEIIIVTGACPGVPLVVAETAYNLGCEIWGFSPSADLQSHLKDTPSDNVKIYSKLIYIPYTYEFKDKLTYCYGYRNHVSTSHVLKGIICQGRWGTLNEATNLIEMGKDVYFYTGTGGIADEMKSFSKNVKKPIKGKLVFESDPEKLVSMALGQAQNGAIQTLLPLKLIVA